MGLEVDYVLKYVNSDWLTSVGDCGITADDYANQYQYNLCLLYTSHSFYCGNVKPADSSFYFLLNRNGIKNLSVTD